MSQQRKVIHVELLEPDQHLYFGSIAAIYDTLTTDQVGIGKEALWNILKGKEYRGRKAIIRQGVILSKRTNRGIKKGGRS